jgi:hypothetical protein
LLKKFLYLTVLTNFKDYEFKSKSEEERIIRWEQYISDEYDTEINKSKKEKTNYKLLQNSER